MRAQGPAIVRTDGGEGVLVTERLPAQEAHPIVRLEVPSGSTLDVKIETGGLTVKEFHGTVRARLTGGSAWIDHAEGRFRVVAAEGNVTFEHIRGGVDVLTEHGSITARQIDGDLQVVTNGGTLDFERIHGPLAARSTSGSITASELNGSARISTRTGSVTVAGATRQLTVRTQSGDVTLDGSVVEHTTLETFKGNMHVKLGAGTDARLEAAARQGIVRTERIATLSGSSRRAVRSILGTGRARLRVATGLGLIEIAGPVLSRPSATHASASASASSDG